MANKADKATVTQRVEEVLSLRLAGAGYLEILQHSTEKGWGLHERQLREYIARSDALLAAEVEKDRPKRLALHLAQRRLLLNKSLEVGDYGNALRVLQDQAKLEGLYPDGRVALQLSGPGGGPIQTENVSDDELEQRIAELETRLPRPA
jgi:hypothetical protein